MLKHFYCCLLILFFAGCGKIENESLELDSNAAIKQAFEFIDKKNWKQASKAVNLALQSNTHAPYLHCLNGSIYEQMWRNDPSAIDLAKVAYRSALSMDPNNHYALLGLGRVLLIKREFQTAREIFAKIILSKPKSGEAYYGLAVASYAMRDSQIAHGAILNSIKLMPNDFSSHRIAVLIFSSLGLFEKAKTFLTKLKELGAQPAEIQYLNNRIEDWVNIHKNNIQKRKSNQIKTRYQFASIDYSPDEFFNDKEKHTQKKEENEEKENSEDAEDLDEKETKNTDDSGSQNEQGSDQLFVADCVILRISEEKNTSRGSNLLESFRVGENSEAGGIVIGSGEEKPNYSRNKRKEYKTNADGSKTFESGSLTIRKGFNISFDTIKYSMNLFNAAKENVQVSAKQTIMASLGKTANFSSGDTLRSGAGGDLGSTFASVPSGTAIEVTPVSFKNQKVMIKIKASCTWLIGESGDQKRPLSEQTVKTYETRIDTEIPVNLNETVVLAGLQEDSMEYKRSETPGLGRIPVIQYLFSNESIQHSKLSSMILITVRLANESSRILNDIFKINPTDYSKLPSLKELKNRNSQVFELPPSLIGICKDLASVIKGWMDGDTNPPIYYEEPFPRKDYFEWLRSFLRY